MRGSKPLPVFQRGTKLGLHIIYVPQFPHKQLFPILVSGLVSTFWATNSFIVFKENFKSPALDTLSRVSSDFRKLGFSLQSKKSVNDKLNPYALVVLPIDDNLTWLTPLDTAIEKRRLSKSSTRSGDLLFIIGSSRKSCQNKWMVLFLSLGWRSLKCRLKKTNPKISCQASGSTDWVKSWLDLKSWKTKKKKSQWQMSFARWIMLVKWMR